MRCVTNGARLTTRPHNKPFHRVVVDPGVLVSALITRGGSGAPSQLLTAWLEGRFTLIVSNKLLAELEGVLLRHKFRRYVTLDEVERYLQLLQSTAELVDDPPQPATSLSADPKDDYLIALAEVCNASALISGDVHLTSALNQSVVIVDPRTFMNSIRE